MNAYDLLIYEIVLGRGARVIWATGAFTNKFGDGEEIGWIGSCTIFPKFSYSRVQ